MDGWNTIVSFWGPVYFHGRTVRFRECSWVCVFFCDWEKISKSRTNNGDFFESFCLTWVASKKISCDMLRLSPTVDDMVNIPLFTGFIRVSYMSGGCFGFLPSTLCNPNDSFQVVTVVIICVSIFTTIRHFLSKLSHGFV